jgi:superoxide dismutase, Fe-Mn family
VDRPRFPHALPDLPYPLDALEPHISRETLEFHHGKHHRAYVDKLNELVRGGPLEGRSLEETVRESSGAVFNNAAQAWNHAFFWQCLGPEAPAQPAGALGKAIEGAFGTFAAFQDKFAAAAVDTFGSGWAWLTMGRDGSVAIRSTGNAGTPIKDGSVPLLTCDVWEHAYYIDYRNERPKYVAAFWRVVNWKFVEANYGKHA